ncbi:MAG: protein kinase [Cyanobacteria bacterium J06623_7]
MPAKVTLTITEGKLKGKEFPFDSRSTCIIGRHPDCNIQIPNDKDHSSISRYHCFLDINPPDIRIKDFGSLHGTYVNGKCIGKRAADQTPEEGAKLKLSEYDLKDGDLIQLSNTTFQVSINKSSDIPPTFIPHEYKGEILSRMDIDLDTDLGSIEGYTKIKLLGRGGCGEVYLARHDTPTRRKLIALKTLLPRVAVMPYMKDRFLKEAELTKMLDHPNLVKFDDYGEANGIFYFTMEFCDRGSIPDLMQKRGGKLSVKEATDIILQVLDGLHYAHTEKNLVHRDIKPGNIFLTVDRGKTVAKLGDYGLAKAFDQAGLSGQTLTGTAMGTPCFMPRQQVLDFKRAKPDVDVWAIAATYYYMLTGFYPRQLGCNIDPMLEILTKPAVPIRERDASITQSLAELLDLALVDNPDLHFKSAIAFKQALISLKVI